jgi:hypothetical protein
MIKQYAAKVLIVDNEPTHRCQYDKLFDAAISGTGELSPERMA